MKIAIVVHGRFHAFDLAGALIRRGHDVHVFTNYPVHVAARFGLPARAVCSFWAHGALSRGARKAGFSSAEAALHRMFGRWAARRVASGEWSIVHSFSGVAEEVLSIASRPRLGNTIVRGSCHIRTQDRLLAEEEQRAGVAVERPSRWMIAREEREYELADRIVTLSNFAHSSFLQRGFSPRRLALIPLAVDVARFRPSPQQAQERRQRILSGQPLRVLFAGTLSFQKGLLDLLHIVRRLGCGPFRFRFLADVPSEAQALVRELGGMAEVLPRQPQADLPRWYAWADVFLFPTIQDGFGMVLAQAQANGLPLLTTVHSAGPDLIREGETGWALPVRAPDRFVEQLTWCHENRAFLAAAADRLAREFHPRAWDDVAAEFEHHCPEPLAMAGSNASDGR